VIRVSVVRTILAIETLITDLPEKKESAGGGHGHGGEMDF
jgi:hypothetical protein